MHVYIQHIHPGHIWYFLRSFDLPYCSLYDLGYTSLGKVGETLPCPALRKIGSFEEGDEYWPAYELVDWTKERAGRVKKGDEAAAEARAESNVAAARKELKIGKPCNVGLLVIGDEILKVSRRIVLPCARAPSVKYFSFRVHLTAQWRAPARYH